VVAAAKGILQHHELRKLPLWKLCGWIGSGFVVGALVFQLSFFMLVGDDPNIPWLVPIGLSLLLAPDQPFASLCVAIQVNVALYGGEHRENRAFYFCAPVFVFFSACTKSLWLEWEEVKELQDEERKVEAKVQHGRARAEQKQHELERTRDKWLSELHECAKTLRQEKSTSSIITCFKNVIQWGMGVAISATPSFGAANILVALLGFAASLGVTYAAWRNLRNLRMQHFDLRLSLRSLTRESKAFLQDKTAPWVTTVFENDLFDAALQRVRSLGLHINHLWLPVLVFSLSFAVGYLWALSRLTCARVLAYFSSCAVVSNLTNIITFHLGQSAHKQAVVIQELGHFFAHLYFVHQTLGAPSVTIVLAVEVVVRRPARCEMLGVTVTACRRLLSRCFLSLAGAS